MITVQDYLNGELLEDVEESKKENDLLDLLEFTKKNGVPLTDNQVKAFILLKELGMEDLANYANAIRPQVTPTKKFFTLINKLTLADRIRGNVKLSKLLGQTPDPNGHMPKGEIQPRAMRESELRR
jgi:hypothetical protein